jgi:hypothetical protein
LPSPHEDWEFWNRLIWGQSTFPPESVKGHCKVTVTQKIKKSTPATPGKNGQQITTLGLANAEGKIEVTIADQLTQDGISSYDLLMFEWFKSYPPKAPAQASHGAFGASGLTDGQITSFDGEDHGDGKCVIKFSFEGWVSPQSFKGQGNVTQTAQAADPGSVWSRTGLPLGEIQPPDELPTGEIQPPEPKP